MNNVYDNAKITAYLLGSLPAAEADIFDELSFTDARFADELSAAEKDLVDAYVNDELRGTTLEQFKTFYLASPLRREKVKFAQAFQQFAKTKNVAEKPVEETPPKRTLAGIFLNIFTIQRPLLQWGFAFAALVLMFFGGWTAWENSRLRLQMEQAQTTRDEILRRESELRQREKQLQDEIAAQQNVNSETEKELAKIREEREKLELELKKQKLPEDRQLAERQETKPPKPLPTAAPRRQLNIASFILTPSLRGNDQLPTLSIPPQTDSAAMQLELEGDDYSAYRVTLQNQSDGKILWQSGKIKSRAGGANKVLNVRFPARLLKTQIYFLEVFGISADGTAEIISNYPFRIVR